MRIGSAWTKNTDDGKTFISVALDEVVIALFPELKDFNISLGHIPAEERRTENSPAWGINISPKKNKANTEQTTPDATNEEIPF